jgi:hypothetical protein
MALSIEVTKGSVTTSQNKKYSITFHVVLTDTEGAGFTKDYSVEYRTGENVANKVSLVVSDIQNDVNRYTDSQTLLNSAGLTTAVTNIQNGIVL